jgi:aerobic carbon-monoxide dehydrogenase medium subunit
MKPGPFAYSAPTTAGETLRVLADLGPDGKVLAGGQSLIPALNMRLATFPHLVDINRVTELDTLEPVTGDGGGCGSGRSRATPASNAPQ